MSKYTTELRFICEFLAGLDESAGFEDVDEVIANSREKIFSFDYPIFDTAYKPVLETKIIEHFYTREICAETYGRWKLFLKAKMNEIMPYFNKLYESELIKINPLRDVDYTREGVQRNQGEQTSVGKNVRDSADSGADNIVGSNTGTVKTGGTDKRTGTNTSTTNSRDKYSEWDLYSDTPQSGVAGILGAEDDPSLEDNGYLTNARHILHDGDGTTSTTTDNIDETSKLDQTRTDNLKNEETRNYGRKNNTTDNSTGNTKRTDFGDYTEHIFGHNSGKSESYLLNEFRTTFLNIDMDVIRALEPLFFQLW